MAELLENKAEEVTDLVSSNQAFQKQLKEIKEFMNQQRDKLQMAKICLLNSRRKVTNFDAFEEYQDFLNRRKK